MLEEGPRRGLRAQRRFPHAADRDTLLAAHAALSAPGDRVVMGAAEDGGYYLLGMKKSHASVLKNIDWSTDRVAQQTRLRARDAGLDLLELDPWYDVDDPQAFGRLVDELSGKASSHSASFAPQTASCLAEMGFFTDATCREGEAA